MPDGTEDKVETPDGQSPPPDADPATRITALEQTVAARDSELAAVRQKVGELQDSLAAAAKETTDAVAAYRAQVLQANPGMVTDMVVGNTVAAINESLAKAKGIVGRVRQSVVKEMAAARVPIGSPGRQTTDLSALSPREKINYGIGGKR